MKLPHVPPLRIRTFLSTAANLVSQLRFLSVIVFTLTILCGASPTFAQEAATGTVTGRVLNHSDGRYLNNARVTVKGTAIQSFTDDDGTYRLANVPSGPITIRVFFTGLEEKEINTVVSPGQTTQQDFDLTSKSAANGGDDMVSLSEYVVESHKETNAAMIAVNEQRFSPNIKNVVSTDAFGPQANHNIGEFLKWLPGVGVEYFANNITGVNVRGLGSINTEITFDGLRQASDFTESNSRGFEMKASSIADIARAEIRLMPLPEDSANAVGGSINLIRRSAFEYSKPQFAYQIYYTSDGEVLTTQERDGPKDRKMQYWRPNFLLTYTNPISKTFGIAISLSHDDKIVRTHWSQPGFNYGTAASNLAYEQAKAAGAPANDPRLTAPSVYNPANQTQLLHDAPIEDTTDSITLKADWKPTPDLIIKQVLSMQRYANQTADDVRYTWATYADQNSVQGGAGLGSAKFNTPLWRDQYSPTRTYSAQLEWHPGDWKINASGAFSYASHSFVDTGDGFFNSTTAGGFNAFPDTGIGVGTANPVPLTFKFSGWNGKMYEKIEAFDAAGNSVDWSKAANLRIGGVRSKPSKDYTTDIPLRVSAKRDFTLQGNPGYIQLGFDYTDEFRNRQRYDNLNWKFVGADHIAGTADDSAGAIIASAISPDRDSYYNAPALEHISLSRLYKLYQDHPDYFLFDAVNSYKLGTQQPMEYEEKTYAPYLQGSLSFFHNRLTFVGGVRFERVTAKGRGYLNNPEAAFQRYTDGSLKHVGDVVDATGLPTVRNPAGAFVYLPGVTAGSLEEAVLTNTAKGASGEGTNQNYFPSLHGTFNITDNLILKAAAGKTQAKNRFDRSVIPNLTVTDTPDTTISVPNSGTVTVRNPDLKPWVAYSYESSLGYYTDSGGSFSIDGYMRSIHQYQVNPHIFLDSAATAAQYGLGPEFVNYAASTWINVGSIKIVGAELSVAQKLDPILPDWARGLRFSATYNYNNLKGFVPVANGDFGNLYDDRETVHLDYGRKWLKASVGYIRTGRIWVQDDPTNGHFGTREYIPVGMWEASVRLYLAKWAELYISANDFTNEAKTRVRRIDGAPVWSRLQIENSLGSTYSIGLTGTF